MARVVFTEPAEYGLLDINTISLLISVTPKRRRGYQMVS